MAPSDDPPYGDDVQSLLAQARESGATCHSLPSEEEFAVIFPLWEVLQTISRRPRSCTLHIRHRESLLLARLTLRRDSQAPEWHGPKPMLEAPHIVPIIEWGASGSDVYLIYEYLDGPTLADAIEQGRVSRKVMFTQVAPQIEKALKEARLLNLVLDTRPEAIIYDEERGLLRLTPLADETDSCALVDWMVEYVSVGTRIGSYSLISLLGEGGFAEVYLAEQREPIRRQVALKILKLGMDSAEALARFNAERQALARLSHPSIASIFDAGATEEGRPYFVMELVDGKPLTEYAAEAQLGQTALLALMREVCAAVQHAHERGIIHRDLKPGNILVTEIDGKPVPKIIDFGIAKATQLPLTEETLHTRFYHLVGSLAYMSPEQASMNQEVDERADVYALGCVLYELLTKRTPLGRRTSDLAPIDALAIIRDNLPPVPSRAAPKGSRISRDLDAVVMKALEKDSGRRYVSVHEFSADAARVLDGVAVSARTPGLCYHTRRLLKDRWVRASLLVGTGALLAALTFLLWPRRSVEDFVAQSRLSDGTVTPVALIQFDGDFRDHTGRGADMKPYGEPDVTFDESEIEGEQAQVLKFGAFGPHQWLSVPNHIGPNGASFAHETNLYSIVMDVYFPELPPLGEVSAIYQAHGSNNGSAEVVVQWDGKVGKGRRVNHGLVAGKWQRFAIVLSGWSHNQTIGFHVNGERIAPVKTMTGGDGHFAVNEAFVFFSDKDGSAISGLINSLAIYDVSLTDHEVAALGPASAQGIPNRCKPEAIEEIVQMMLPEPGTTIRPPEPGDFRQGYQLALDAPHGRCLISTRGTTACYGGAWVYRYDGGDGWSLNGELVSRKGFRDNMGFGESVALQGDWAAVSSPDDLEERGSVSVYHREDEGKWAHHKLLISPSRDDLYLGLQINFDAQQLLAYGYVGFNLAECNRMHRFDIANGKWAHREAFKSPVWMWTPVKPGFQPPLGEDSPAWHQPRTNDPMAVSGDWLVQGRPSWGTTGDAMIFHKGKDGSWQSIFRITPVEGADQRLFGGNLAMDESTFAVWSRDIAGRLGHVDVFQVNDSESECRLIHRLTYLWPGDLDVHMRVSIALGGRHLVMSTPDQGGRVHFYELDKLPVWNGNGNALYSIEMVTGENEVSQSLAENEITLAWQGPVEAAVGIAGQFYLFSQDRFQRIDGTSLAVVESGIVGRDGWDGLWLDGVEAACGRSMFGEAVFIKGDWNQSYYFQNRQYKNLEMKQDHRWTSADASFMHPDRNTYVFQGGTYFRRGVGSSTVEDSGSISDLLPGAWSEDIDAAACPTGDDRLFLFKGKRFQVFDFSENRVVKEGALRYEASSP